MLPAYANCHDGQSRVQAGRPSYLAKHHPHGQNHSTYIGSASVSASVSASAGHDGPKTQSSPTPPETADARLGHEPRVVEMGKSKRANQPAFLDRKQKPNCPDHVRRTACRRHNVQFTLSSALAVEITNYFFFCILSCYIIMSVARPPSAIWPNHA